MASKIPQHTVIPAEAAEREAPQITGDHLDRRDRMFSICSKARVGAPLVKQYFVYMLASCRNGTLYCGVTSRLAERTWQHRTGEIPGFTRKYNVKMLVWFEEYGDAAAAIHRETQIKWWKRAWKLKLIEDFNPEWRDLYETLLPGPVRTYDKPPVVDPKRSVRKRMSPDDPFLTSFDASGRTPL